ncbi:hypothetical protein ACTXM8_10380 [Brachybacterium alimentarium]|uniref:hypothetical protein n=1 Tax=Brachybacterium alimentarium TaxID=47845 RepID=UPI003FD5D558
MNTTDDPMKTLAEEHARLFPAAQPARSPYNSPEDQHALKLQREVEGTIRRANNAGTTADKLAQLATPDSATAIRSFTEQMEAQRNR